MQQTRFDRWIRERFVYETHVYSMRPATQVPRRAKIEELPEAPGRQYRVRYIVRRSRDVETLIAQLKEDGQMFTTRVLDRTAWYIPFLAPKGKSLTWILIWSTSGIASGFYGLSRLWNAWNDPEIRRRAMEALEILKG